MNDFVLLFVSFRARKEQHNWDDLLWSDLLFSGSYQMSKTIYNFGIMNQSRQEEQVLGREEEKENPFMKGL